MSKAALRVSGVQVKTAAPGSHRLRSPEANGI